MLTLPTPGMLSRERGMLSASLYSSSGEAGPDTEMMRMGCVFTSNFVMTGREASLGRLSAMPSSAFCTSMTAEFMSVDILNWRIVYPNPVPEVERTVSMPFTPDTASSMGLIRSLSISSAPAPI